MKGSLPDFDKPPCPYTECWQFTVQEHIPLPATSVNINENDHEEMMHFSLLERCLRHPPFSGSTGPSRISLETLHPVRAGDGHHSQLVVVRPLWCSPALDILGIKNTRIVAKIYDPLYTEDDGYTNQFHLADIHYMHEAKAYAALSKFQASKIPKYYGSYTLSIPVENQQTERQMRLILLELIPGMSMASAKPEDYSQSTRKQIMKTIEEFETDLYTRDLVHHDIHPRNIMIGPELHPSNPEEVKVVFIDFADVEFSRIRNKSYGVKEESLLPKTYISPLLRWHCAHSRFSEFEEWIDWDWQPWLEKEFEDTAATITERMCEVFLPDWFLEDHHEWTRERSKRR